MDIRKLGLVFVFSFILASAMAMANISFTDDFERANSDNLGNGWIELNESSSSAAQILDGNLYMSNTASAVHNSTQNIIMGIGDKIYCSYYMNTTHTHPYANCGGNASLAIEYGFPVSDQMNGVYWDTNRYNPPVIHYNYGCPESCTTVVLNAGADILADDTGIWNVTIEKYNETYYNITVYRHDTEEWSYLTETHGYDVQPTVAVSGHTNADQQPKFNYITYGYIKAPPVFIDYDTFTRANNDSMGVSEKEGVTYAGFGGYITTVLDGTANLTDTGNRGLTWDSETAHVNATRFFKIKTASGTTWALRGNDPYVDAPCWFRIMTNGTIGYTYSSDDVSIPDTSLTSTGVQAPDDEYVWYGIFTDSVRNVCSLYLYDVYGTSLFSATELPVTHQDVLDFNQWQWMYYTGYPSNPGGNARMDEWYACEGLDLDCHSDFEIPSQTLTNYTFTDNFNRADNTVIGNHWTEFAGTTWAISSNALNQGGVASQFAQLNLVPEWGDDGKSLYARWVTTNQNGTNMVVYFSGDPMNESNILRGYPISFMDHGTDPYCVFETLIEDGTTWGAHQAYYPPDYPSTTGCDDINEPETFEINITEVNSTHWHVTTYKNFVEKLSYDVPKTQLPELKPTMTFGGWGAYSLNVDEVYVQYEPQAGGCTDEDDCGTCEKCSANVCIYQTDAEDLKDDCIRDMTCTSPDAWGASGANGLCDGAGACKLDAVEYVEMGKVCIGGDVNATPTDTTFCGFYANCVNEGFVAQEYIVGFNTSDPYNIKCTDYGWVEYTGNYWPIFNGYPAYPTFWIINATSHSADIDYVGGEFVLGPGCSWRETTACNPDPCGPCEICTVDNVCRYQHADEDYMDECAPTMCFNNYTLQSGTGFCNGAGSCDASGGFSDVSAGNVCSGGVDSDPTAENNCGIWSNCVQHDVSAAEYYVGYAGNGTSDCVDTDWQSAGTYQTSTQYYWFTTTEHVDTCSEEAVPNQCYFYDDAETGSIGDKWISDSGFGYLYTDAEPINTTRSLRVHDQTYIHSRTNSSIFHEGTIVAANVKFTNVNDGNTMAAEIWDVSEERIMAVGMNLGGSQSYLSYWDGSWHVTSIPYSGLHQILYNFTGGRIYLYVDGQYLSDVVDTGFAYELGLQSSALVPDNATWDNIEIYSGTGKCFGDKVEYPGWNPYGAVDGYRLNSDPSNFINSSNNGVDGGGMSYNTSAGMHGAGFFSDSYVNVGNFMGGMSEFTFVTWAYFRTFTDGGGNHPYLYGSRDGPEDFGMFGMNPVGEGGCNTPTVRDTVPGGGFHLQCYNASVCLNTYTWYHFAVTSEAGVGAKIYMNGVKIADCTGPEYSTWTASPAGRTWHLGDNGANGNYHLRGLMDDVLLFPTALTSAHITNMYSGTYGPIDSDPPVIVIGYPPSDDYFIDYPIYVAGTATDENLDSVWINDSRFTNVGSAASFNFTNNTGLSDGAYAVTIYANDTFGNVDSASRTFIIDSIYPLINLEPGNFFAADNSTVHRTQNNNVTLVISIHSTDEHLTSFMLNITQNSTGEHKYDYINSTTDPHEILFAVDLNVTEWNPFAYYRVRVQADNEIHSTVKEYLFVIDSLEDPIAMTPVVATYPNDKQIVLAWSGLGGGSDDAQWGTYNTTIVVEYKNSTGTWQTIDSFVRRYSDREEYNLDSCYTGTTGRKSAASNATHIFLQQNNAGNIKVCKKDCTGCYTITTSSAAVKDVDYDYEDNTLWLLNASYWMQHMTTTGTLLGAFDFSGYSLRDGEFAVSKSYFWLKNTSNVLIKVSKSTGQIVGQYGCNPIPVNNNYGFDAEFANDVPVTFYVVGNHFATYNASCYETILGYNYGYGYLGAWGASFDRDDKSVLMARYENYMGPFRYYLGYSPYVWQVSNVPSGNYQWRVRATDKFLTTPYSTSGSFDITHQVIAHILNATCAATVPNPGSTVKMPVEFNIEAIGGNDVLSAGTAQITLDSNKFSASCAITSTSDITSRANCNITMWYYYSAGMYDLNVSVYDGLFSSTVYQVNSSYCEYYQSLSSEESISMLSFITLNPGIVNQSAQTPLIINNTGNVPLQLSIIAYDLQGNMISNQRLLASNFRAGLTNNVNSAVQLNNSIKTSLNYNVSGGSYATLYFFVSVPRDTYPQTYYATSPWQIGTS